MKISELITALESAKAKYGDLPVLSWHSFNNEWEPVSIEPFIFGDEDDAIHIDP